MTASPRLKVITEEWPPFNYSENGEIKGFATEVMKLVMKELDVNYKIDILPESRGMNTLNKGTRVLFFSFIMTPERKSLYKWIGPIGDQAIHFYKRKDSHLQIKSLEDAKKVGSICCRNMGLVYTTLKKAGFKNLDVGSNPEGSYLKAIHGRCDLAIGETDLGVAYWLKKSNYSPSLLEQTPVKVTDSPLYFVVSKDVPDEEVLRWQQALEKVKSSKEYSKLYKAYREDSK
ncbi:substrate-binding periplasmic protein [Bdellovibrio sp. HCB337]|uniref:substrate-binding periplasmic protein n=1 Tax=Bdellovibrio sp. HCB337 TaxID=3394358 RepID=UPI0039A54813